MTSKSKTSIYIDRELWEKFKRHARARGVEVSRLLEELMREELVEEELGKIIGEWLGDLDELDFEPIPPRGGAVSVLVREMRDERCNSLLGQ